MPFAALVDAAPRPQAQALARHPSLALRVRVRLRRLDLTRRLAEGADPFASPGLALRARQLTSSRALNGCVERLEGVLRDSVSPPRGLSAQAPLQREAILGARPFLQNLLQRLRETENPRPAGVARTLLLLTDGCGPLYAPSPPGTLASRAYRAADAL
jgi:hypothetical protein